MLAFLETARLVSGTYFAGADILYPATREYLESVLGRIGTPWAIYEDLVQVAPRTDDEFRDYVLGLEKTADSPRAVPIVSLTGADSPEVRREARRLANQWVLMPQSETHAKLGEHREAEALEARVVRQLM